MRTWTMRLGLSLMVVVGLWTNRAPAQENLMPPAQECVRPPLYVTVAPTLAFIPDHHPYYSPLYPPPPPCQAKHAVVRVLNHFGMGCKADSFGSVGSFVSEFRWAFGSSRSFFEEPCCPPGQPCADGRNP